MIYRKLGRTDIDISGICLGCWAFSNDFMWHDQAEKDSINTIHAALDLGINILDTAEGYGDGYSEEVVGKALAGRRDRTVIATKVSGEHLAPIDLVAACENSLRRLKTDYIDLYQIHWPSRTIALAQSMEALERLQDQGKIRAIGVSNFGPADLDELNAVGRAESNQLAYSLLARAIEYEIVPRCVEAEIGILCYSPLMHGILTGKFSNPEDVPDERARTRHFSPDRPMTVHRESGFEAETFAALDGIRAVAADLNQPMTDVAVAWLLAREGVSSVITGARRPDQIEEIAQAAQLVLSQEAIAALEQATDPIKEYLGANADMWRTDSRLR